MYNNYILTADGKLYAVGDELYHHGVKGMKWGHRKAADERAAYKQARKNYKTARRNAGVNAYFAFGREGLKGQRNLEKKRDKAELDMIDAKAKYKAAKAGSAEKAKKAEMKVYRKEMSKSGLVNSAADNSSGGRSTRLYNHMKVTKGKKYADAVEQKVQNVAVAQIAGGAAVVVGSQVVAAMMYRRY